MKIRKFYKQAVSQIDGPKEKLNILGPKTEIEEKEAQETLNAFFDTHPNPKAEMVKAQAWTLILKGEQVTIKDNCLSSKVFNLKDSRISGLLTAKN